jgi:hypothetical protein
LSIIQHQIRRLSVVDAIGRSASAAGGISGWIRLCSERQANVSLQWINLYSRGVQAMNMYVAIGTIGVMVGTLAVPTSAVFAQNPAQTPAPTTQPKAAPAQQTTTLAGCLYRERDVPGRQPNVAEKAGVLEDYILVEMPAATTAAKPGAVGTAGSTAAGKMYKVEQIPDEKLRALVGKRVEATGRIDPEAGGKTTPQPDRGVGPDDINLPEFEATEIREASGTCPASPAPAR